MRQPDARGFTLPEVMAGIVIMGIVIAASVPNLVSYRESQRMATACDRVAAACRAARAQARSQNHSIIVEYRTDDSEIAVIEDADDNGVADAGEPVHVFSLPGGVTLASTTFTGDQLVFNGRGQALEGGSVTLQARSDRVEPMRVRVSAGTGYVKVVPGDG